MKVKISELSGIWSGINNIYKNNDTLDGVFDYFMQKQNIPILRKEIQKLQDVDDDTYQDLADKTLDLPLSTVKPEHLPKVNKGVIHALDPIIEGEVDFSDYESQIDKLMEEEDYLKEQSEEDQENRAEAIEEEENEATEEPA